MIRKYKTYMTIDLDAFTELYKGSKGYRVARVLKLLVDSIRADNIDPENLEQNDLLLNPQNHVEEIFWKICRERAKKDRKTLETYINNGTLGGRPKTISKEEKQQTIDNFTNNFGKKVGKNQVQITDDFKLPDIEYFNVYRKNYPAQLIQNVENWLIKSKKNETIDYQWIGNLIQKFNKRKTGNPL